MGAIQKGLIKIHKGSLGDSTFSNTNNGFTIKPKKRESSNRKGAPNYARSRENAVEFSQSSSCARLVRQSVNGLTGTTTDSKMMLKLSSTMAKIIALDPDRLRGSRMPTPQNLTLLTGFSMNLSASLKDVFNSRFRISANRARGEYNIYIPSFVPAACIRIPKTATHFQIISAASAIDFAAKEKEYIHAASERITLDNTPTQDIQLLHTLTPGSIHPVLIFLGIQFLQVNASEISIVANRKLDPLDIVEVVVE